MEKRHGRGVIERVEKSHIWQGGRGGLESREKNFVQHAACYSETNGARSIEERDRLEQHILTFAWLKASQPRKLARPVFDFASKERRRRNPIRRDCHRCVADMTVNIGRSIG